MMNIFKLAPVLVLIFCCIATSVPLVYAETLTQTFDGGMDLEITYPNSVIIGRTFSVSIHLENNGWENKQDISAIDFVKKIENFGVSRIIYTDINKDGTKKGPNIKDTVELSSKVKIPFVISGGISSIEDIKKIKSLNNSNIEGVIVGKSIYDGDIKINELAKQI